MAGGQGGTPSALTPTPPSRIIAVMANDPLQATHAMALPAGPAPEWVHLIPAGTFSGRDDRGPYRANPQSVIAAFAAWGMPVAIDYEHQGINAADNGQPAPAAGWIKELQARDDGLWGKVDWTAKAAAMIAEQEYKYLSPVFDHTKDGGILRLTGCGLTNNPNLFLTALARRSAHSQEIIAMDLLASLIKTFDLPGAATPEEVLAKVQDAVDGSAADAVPVAQMRKALGLADDAALAIVASSMQARIKSAEPDPGQYVPRAEFERVAQSLSGIQTARAEEAAERLVKEAMTAGKVSPGMEAWARSYCSRDRAGFEKYLETAPAIVDGHARMPASPPKTGEENPLLKNARARAAKK